MSLTKESRDRYLLYAPPRSAVRQPGEAGERGLVGRLQDSKQTGCMLLVFVLVGVTIALFGVAGLVGPWKESLRAGNDPRSFYGATAFGAVFVLVALRMLQVVLTETENERRRNRTRPAASAQPWTADHPWRPEAMLPDGSADAGGSVLGRVAIFALIGLFNLGLGSGEPVLIGIIVILDLLGLLILYDSLLKLWHALRLVRPRMRWATFPAFLGGRLEGVFRVRPAQHVLSSIQARLRCVRDEPGANGLEPYVIYEQIHELPPPGEILTELPVAFDLPWDAPGTDLGQSEPTYWQVVLRLPVPGPDIEAVFLAPVYEQKG